MGQGGFNSGGGGGTAAATVVTVDDFDGVLGEGQDSVQEALDALDDHNHDLAYSATGHNHDSSYSATGHNHDLTYVPLTRQINSKQLNNDVTLSTADVADSSDKRYCTEAEKAIIANINQLPAVGLPSSLVFCDDVIFGGTSPVWHELESQSDGGTVGSHTATTTSYTEMDRYVTPALGTTVIPEGMWSFTMYAKVSAQSGQLQAQIYRVNSSGVVVGGVLATAQSAVFTNTTTIALPMSVYLGEQTGWAVTDRVGIVISGKKVGAPAATVTWYHDRTSGYLSEVVTPIALLHNQMAGLNEGDYVHLTAAEKSKLDGIEAGAEVNVQSDWTASSGDAFIANKPSTFAPIIGTGETDAAAGNHNHDSAYSATGHNHDLAYSIAGLDVVGGRLEAASTTSLEWAFDKSNQILLYNGTAWTLVKCSAKPTASNTAHDLNGTDLAVDKIYDVFAEYSSATAFNLAFSRWNAATAGSSARNAAYDSGTAYAIGDRVTSGGHDYVCIQAGTNKTPSSEPTYWCDNGTSVTGDFAGLYRQDGILVSGNDTAGKQRRWLGVIYTYSDGGTVNFKDTANYRYINNVYNPKNINVAFGNSNALWAINSSVGVRESNNGSGAIRANFVLARTQNIVIGGRGQISPAASNSGWLYLDVDTTEVGASLISYASNTTLLLFGGASYVIAVGSGMHYLAETEYTSITSGSVTFYSSSTACFGILQG